MFCPRCKNDGLVISDIKAECLFCGFWCWYKFLFSYYEKKQD